MKRQSAVAAILAATCLASPAYAGSLYAFGDSLVDNGNIPRLIGLDFPPAPYVGNRFSNGPVWAEYLPALAGLGFKASNDFAVGGAFAGPLTILGTSYNNLENLPPFLGEPGFTGQLPSFLGQVSEFQATGQRFSRSDVVGVWVGANDYFATIDLIQAGLETPAAGVAAAVQLVAQQTTLGVDELTALGARRFLVFNLPELGETPEYNTSDAATIGLADEISTAHNTALVQSLSAAHRSTGANIILVNEAQIFDEVLANPAAYGKTNTTDACIDTPACVDAPVTVQNQYVFWDVVHPTTGTHLFIAKYAAAALSGLAGLAAPAQIAADGSDAFTSQLAQRTQALRAGANGFSVDLPDQGMSGQIGTASHGLSGFFSGSYDFGNRKTIGADNGFNYNIGTFAFGLDDQLAQGFAVGAALGYGTDHGTVTDDGKISANAYQFGAYAAFYRPRYYVTLNAAYGFDDYNNSRPGVVGGKITGKPSGNTASLSAETGYVITAGRLTFGPLAGIKIIDATLGGFTERGDAALTQSVSDQSFTPIVGDVGVTAAADLPIGAVTLHPHLTAKLEQLFSGNGGNFDSVFTDEPGVTLTTEYPHTAKTWGEISGGISGAVTPRISLTLDFASTVAKSDGGDHAVSGGAKVSF